MARLIEISDCILPFGDSWWQKDAVLVKFDWTFSLFCRQSSDETYIKTMDPSSLDSLPSPQMIPSLTRMMWQVRHNIAGRTSQIHKGHILMRLDGTFLRADGFLIGNWQETWLGDGGHSSSSLVGSVRVKEINLRSRLRCNGNPLGAPATPGQKTGVSLFVLSLNHVKVWLCLVFVKVLVEEPLKAKSKCEIGTLMESSQAESENHHLLSSVSNLAPAVLVELALKGRVFRVCIAAKDERTWETTPTMFNLIVIHLFNTYVESTWPMPFQDSDEIGLFQRRIHLGPIESWLDWWHPLR